MLFYTERKIMWTFVTFHAAMGDEVHHKLRKRGVDLMMQSSYEAQINWLFRSADRFYPGCRKVIITDQNTRFEAAISQHLQGETEIFRSQFPGSGAMLSRARAQTEWLAAEALRGDVQDHPIVMLDSDILINRELEALGANDYDIGLTHRRHDEMPINGGTFFIAPQARAAALQFSRWVQLTYETGFAQDIWYGHQHALIKTIDWQNYRKTLKSEDRILLLPSPFSQEESDPVRIRLFGRHHWNHTASVKVSHIKQMPEARILHFKGPLKILMRPYFLGYVRSPQSLGDHIKRMFWRAILYFLAGIQKSLKRLNKLVIFLSSR